MKTGLAIFVFLVCMLNTVNIRAQLSVRKIKTEKQAASFIATHYLGDSSKAGQVRFTKFVDPGYAYYVDTTILRYVAEQHAPNWIKRDFNGDGKMDIVFSGYINDAAKIIAFMTEGKAYRHYDLCSRYDDDGIPFIKPCGKNSLVINVIDATPLRDPEYDKLEDRLRTDTIAWTEYGFLDYDFGRKTRQIDSLIVSYGVSIHPVHDVVSITREGQCSLTTIERSPDTTIGRQQSLYRLQVSRDSLLALMNMAQQTPVWKYNGKSFGPIDGVLDGWFWTLVIRYTDGTRKSLASHMGVGPLGFQALCSRVQALKKTFPREYIKRLRP